MAISLTGRRRDLALASNQRNRGDPQSQTTQAGQRWGEKRWGESGWAAPGTLVAYLILLSNKRRLILSSDVSMSADDIWIIESPVTVIAGESLTFSHTWLGATSVSSPTATVYQNGTDVTSTVMPSGSHSASGNVQTLKPITSLIGGEDYVAAIQASVDGNTEIRKCLFHCVKAEAES